MYFASISLNNNEHETLLLSELVSDQILKTIRLK